MLGVREREPPMTRVFKSESFDGGPVTAVVRSSLYVCPCYKALFKSLLSPCKFLLLISFFLLTSCKNDSPEFTPSQWEERRDWIGSIIKDYESIENGVTESTS